MPLVLFDIDGTLVRKAGPHHRQALVDAVRDVLGLESTTEGIPVQGMLDPVILTEMLTAVGVSAAGIAEAMPALIDAAGNHYTGSVPDLRDKHCPGVVALLDGLQKRQIPLALVTGNLTRIGWRKMDRAGLAHYFGFGAFGEMAPTRGALAGLAIERALGEGLIRAGAAIALIGDAPQDVRAARENRIFSVAVRTGISPPEELEAECPDLLLNDLTKLDAGFLDGVK